MIEEAHLLEAYKKDLNRFSRISSKEAADLTPMIQAGIGAELLWPHCQLCMQKHLPKGEPVIGESERLYNHYISAGQAAQNKLIESNLQLGIWIAWDYLGQGLSIMDIIQEANLGLMRAVQTFNPEKGEFSTYAAIGMRQHIKRAIDNTAKEIRIPVGMLEKIYKARNAFFKLSSELGRFPEIEEVAAEMKTTPAQLENILNAESVETVPLSSKFNSDEDEDELAEKIASPGDDPVYKTVENRLLKKDFEFMVSALPENQRSILELNLGWKGDRGTWTLSEIAHWTGTTPQNISLIRFVAFRQMQPLAEKLGLREYLN